MRAPILCLAGLVPLAACAPEGPYPSLEVRPIEKRYAAAGDEPGTPAPPSIPEDVTLADRVAALSAAALQGQIEFARALPIARAAVARAGAPGSDSWIDAQQAASRLEVARALTVDALTELDQLALEKAAAGPLAPADAMRIASAIVEASALADGQAAANAEITRALGSI